MTVAVLAALRTVPARFNSFAADCPMGGGGIGSEFLTSHGRQFEKVRRTKRPTENACRSFLLYCVYEYLPQKVDGVRRNTTSSLGTDTLELVV